MGKNWFDLHLHSCFSDGRLSPVDLIGECKRKGMEVVALTDHESVKGVPGAISAGQRLGVKVVPGIEFSADFNGEEYHLLGFSLDYESVELSDFAKTWESTKRQQIEEMVCRLQNIGFSITFDEVTAQSRGALNRAHIAYAMLEKPENTAVLERFNLKTSSDFFLKFLKEGSPIYAKRHLPQATEVISLVKRLNGLAVWAHPFWKLREVGVVKETAAYFQKFGLDGLEVGYSSDYQGRTETVASHQIAQELSMIETAGSDFHAFEIPFLNEVAHFELFGLEINLPSFSLKT